MYLLSLIVRPYLRTVMGVIAALTLILAGLCLFADSSPRTMWEPSPITPLPAVSTPLDFYRPPSEPCAAPPGALCQ
ncbi:hypothetical protein [Nocardia seriolae]|uniref:Uncharacterized protein n=1 Tax=Nocardia seriolae TaxID=37332 RepID=A0A0B8N0Y9_9NOCA|nr:hypothetical protein [Nocardia seriolae]APB01463.1 hypothetical protein NS506_07443 [Nocardia seriolae]MTJ61050.1 hypothetical protein [Nocardia seriolae]MTJ70489.1 hypothetical protein [Nocardia seriolae]MTJ90818.1 hypothetical protein [Nocardia seriolae]MTK34775.1 hypothetical protein [Nocardia seriolae]